MPLYVVDFEADTAHLSVEEDGAFNRLLRLCWRSPGCSIPHDPAWIMRQMRVDQETYDRAVAPVLAEFFKVRRGKIHSPRLTREFKKLQATFQKRSSAGKKGGRPSKALENKDAAKSPEKAGPKQPEPEPEPKESGGGSAREGSDEIDAFKLAAKVDPSKRALDGWIDFHVIKALERWRALGLTDSEILEVIAAVMDGRPDPPNTPTYFDKAMQRAAGRKQAGNLEPIPFDKGAKHGKPTSEQRAEERLQARLERARAQDLASGRG